VALRWKVKGRDARNTNRFVRTSPESIEANDARVIGDSATFAYLKVHMQEAGWGVASWRAPSVPRWTEYLLQTASRTYDL